MKFLPFVKTLHRPFFVLFKKHYCPVCGEMLGTIKAWSIVHAKSEEAKNYNFSFFDEEVHGYAKFIWTEFLCRKCEKAYPVNEIYKLEKEAKKRNRKRS